MANDPAAKAAIRVIAIAEDVAVAAADAVLHVVDAVQAGEAGITIVRHAKIIHLKGIARNHASGKRIIVNVKMARVMKMRMFPPRWMRRRKAKGRAKPRPTTGMKRMNFTKNGPMPTAKIRKNADGNLNARGTTAGASASVDGDMTGAGVIEIGTAIGIEVMSVNVRFTVRYAAKSIEFGTAWRRCCAIWNAS